MEDDVKVFYFPLVVATTQALAHGTLALWTPSVFGGYPLFADGEAGMLYPLHLIAYRLLAPETSIVVLRIVHSFMASGFAYLFARALGARPVGAVITGITYAYSSFAAEQIIHTNMFEGMVWLPLELALLERALQTGGAARYRYAVLVGAVVGIQALALHIHVTMMSAVAIGVYLGYRGLVVGWQGSDRRRGLLRGLIAAATILAIVGTIGIGLGAIQLLPLDELAQQTYRGSGLSESRASVNSIWPGGLLTLLLPGLFDTAKGGFWGPWVKWETTVYVGMMPMILAVIGVTARSGRHRWFFAAVAAVSLALALGAYAPVRLWDALHDLPGFESLQSPGRFTLLFCLAVAVLAGYGADWLAECDTAGPRRFRYTRAAVGAAAGLAVVLGIAKGLAIASERIADINLNAPSPIDQYLHLPGIPANVDDAELTAQRVRDLAAHALFPGTVTTASQLLLASAAVAIVGLWLLSGTERARRLRIACAALATCLTFVDLCALGLTAHPFAPIASLRPRLPAVLYQPVGEQYRVYTPPTTEDKRTQVEPNRLLAAGLQEANGYSSLEPDRHAAYVAAVQYTDNQLLDLWNVRYVVKRVRQQLFPSYAGVSFHPQRPLLSGKDEGADGSLVPDGGAASARELDVVSAMWDAADVPNGKTIAKIRVRNAEGDVREFPFVAGRDVSDGAMDVPGNTRTFAHARATVAFQYQRFNPDGDAFGEQLYFTRIPINPPMAVTSVTVDHLDGVGALEVYGVGLVDPKTGDVTQARDKRKYHLVYRDQQIQVFENSQVMDRAFLVDDGLIAPPGRDVLAWMRDGTVELARSAILECGGEAACGAGGSAIPHRPPGASETPPGHARIVSYASDRVVVNADATHSSILLLTDPYFPGWVAEIDGKPTAILRADYMFRGVLVPSGSHVVTFTYRPISVAFGFAGTLLTGICVLALFVVPDIERLRRRAGSAIRSLKPRAVRQPAPGYALSLPSDPASQSIFRAGSPHDLRET